MKLRAMNTPWYQGIGLVFQDGVSFSTDITMEDFPSGQQVDPVTVMSIQEATELMDELWHCGIRPTHEGSTGQLKATERHLEDMRTLVFKNNGE